ncbi:MAG: rod shape-determining protein RodA [Acidobacteria bacterium]|nr:MAG: rod shape-determining protein RodA [Acidobacteriota bacterium]
MKKFVSLRDFDWVLLLLVLLICAVGVTQIYSATMSSRFADVHMYVKQIYWIAGGLVFMLLLSLINYEALLDSVHWMYIAAVISLMAVLVFGTKYLGARRWIRLPAGVHFQPSEWVKLILILAMAKYFSDLRQRDASLTDILKAALLGGIPMLMVLVQPDLGTALTYIPILVMGLFLGGIQFKHAAAIILIGAALAVPAFKHLKPYQRGRLTSFLNPAADSQGKGYQGEQSKIAVGAGGIWGKGFGKGSQTQNSFLPIPQTDFIFAAFSEEHGFVGAVGLLLLYFIVLMRLIHNAQTAPDRAGAIVILGVVAVLTFHILVNVGMVVGFMPVTGIPLPLMSYGGSSLLFTFLALGIVMNIRMRRFVN